MRNYCTQNDWDCETCSLVNYGKDCRNNPIDPDHGNSREARIARGEHRREKRDENKG